MKLEFRLLLVDDEPDNIQQALESLRDHLDTVGFELQVTTVEDVAQLSSVDLGGGEGKNYDLVMVDYNLGQASTDGAKIAGRIRATLRYTDMVFYSSQPVPTLLSHLAAAEVAGVFAEERFNLDDALTALADTVIGKAVDLNHMRGIAMAEVAEMDVLMENTLKRAFANATAECVQAAADRTCKKVLKAMSRNKELATARVDAGDVVSLVGDGLLFSSVHKFRAIQRLAKCAEPKPSQELTQLGSYEEEVTGIRNVLAHAKENVDENGNVVLESLKGQERLTITDEWMANCRRDLGRHREALSAVCARLDECFAAGDGTGGPE